MVTVALEMQHRVDEMLERARARDPSVFGDVTDDHERRAERAACRGELVRAMAHLSD